MTATRCPRRAAPTDAGTSLIELVVGMILTMIFGAIFTASIYLMSSTANKAESVTNTSAQLSAAIQRLDKTVRYATALSQPGQAAGGGWYVEMRTTNTGAEQCTQLRIDPITQQLQQRTWSVLNSAAIGLTAFLPFASGITNGAVASTSTTPPVPFVLIAARNSVTFERLTVNLVAVTGNPATTSTSSVTFAAVNSTATTSTANVCQQVGRP